MLSDSDATRPVVVETSRLRWLVSNTGLKTLQWRDISGKWIPIPEVEAKDVESET